MACNCDNCKYEQGMKDGIRKFAEWAYINGIDFSYMGSTKKHFVDDTIDKFYNSLEENKE